jgi:predicted SnoaL-like aldol condensation-catalyzing enzyme
MINSLRVTLVIAVFLTVTVCFAQVPVTATKDQKALLKSSNPKLAKNKKIVYDMWRSVLEGGHLELADKYLADSYIQHNPTVPTGKKGFVDFFSQFAKPQPIADTIKGPLVAIVAEGDYVTLSFVRELPDPNDPTKKYTTTCFDMFRIETDASGRAKIAEHWDTAEIMKR